MHLHQPVSLALGLIMIPVGILGLGLEFVYVYTRTFKNRYSDWRALSWSLWFLTSGATHISAAFDPWHHDSHTTSILAAIAVGSAVIIVTAHSIAWAVRRRQSAGKPVTEAAAPETRMR